MVKLLRKVAIVTGSGSGIGEAIAIAFAGEGANVAVFDINLENARRVVNRIKSQGGSALAVHVDVMKSEQVSEATKLILDQYGKIDILVNNAGGSTRRGLYLFIDSNEDDWDYAINLNLKSVFIVTRAVLEPIIKNGGGKIINISSTTALGGHVGEVDYSAAKAGVMGFTRSLAKEVAQYNINVNCIVSGPTDTPGLRSLNMPVERLEELKKATFLGRLGKPEDIANMAVFLTSEGASFITGQCYAVCGARNLP